LDVIIYDLLVYAYSTLKIWDFLWEKMKDAPALLFGWLENKWNSLGPIAKILAMTAASGVAPGIAMELGAYEIHHQISAPSVSAGAAVSPLFASAAGTSSPVQHTVDTHIDQITIQTAAMDAPGIAADIGGAIKHRNLVDFADMGVH
jgi:hypothetical protein